MPAIAGTWPIVAVVPGSGGFRIWSNEYTTSSAVSSWPLWNWTPLRRFQTIRFELTTS